MFLRTTTKPKALGGHLGRDKTWKLLDSGFWWSRMNKDVRNYVATYEACQNSISKMEKTFPELHPILVLTKVWHQVGVDLCTLSKNPEGYVGIFVVTDYFSKWVEAKSSYRKNLEVVARNFIRTYISQWLHNDSK